MNPSPLTSAGTPPAGVGPASRGRIAAANDHGFAAALGAATVATEEGGAQPGNLASDSSSGLHLAPSSASSDDASAASEAVVVTEQPIRVDGWSPWLLWSGLSTAAASNETVEVSSGAAPETAEIDGAPVAESAIHGETASTSLASPAVVVPLVNGGAATVPVSAPVAEHADTRPASGSHELAAAETRGAVPGAPASVVSTATDTSTTAAATTPTSTPSGTAVPPEAGPVAPFAAVAPAASAQNRGALSADIPGVPAEGADASASLQGVPTRGTSQDVAADTSTAQAVAAPAAAKSSAASNPAAAGDARASAQLPTGGEATPDAESSKVVAAATRAPESAGFTRADPGMTHAPDGLILAPTAPSRPMEGLVGISAAEAAAPSDLAANVLDQVVKSLRMQWKGGLGEARIQLRPEHLGPVEISIRVEAGSVTAIVRAESSQVQEWILSHQQSLRQQLEAAGLRLDDLVVSRDGERREQQHDEHERARRSATRRRRDGQPEPTFTLIA